MSSDIGEKEWIMITKRGVGELHIILQVLFTAADEQSNGARSICPAIKILSI